jgi:hypothetical protein
VAYLCFAFFFSPAGQVHVLRLYCIVALPVPHMLSVQAWAELEAADGQWLLAIKLLEQALAADRQHLPSWMVSSSSTSRRAVGMCAVNSVLTERCTDRYSAGARQLCGVQQLLCRAAQVD